MAQNMGYSHANAWYKIIIPQLYSLIRLPVLLVLVYALSTVDMALILGPNTPPTLALDTMRWYNDPNIAILLPGSAKALPMSLILGLLSLVVLLIWSFTWRWSYSYWLKLITHWPLALQHSIILALGSSAIAIIFAVAWLEVRDRFGGYLSRLTLWFIYLPLLVPQIAFLYGLKVGFLRKHNAFELMNEKGAKWWI
jgi:putative thiamine transport system permease protein